MTEGVPLCVLITVLHLTSVMRAVLSKLLHRRPLPSCLALCQVAMLMNSPNLNKNTYFIDNLNLISTKSQTRQREATMGKVQLVPLSLKNIIHTVTTNASPYFCIISFKITWIFFFFKKCPMDSHKSFTEISRAYSLTFYHICFMILFLYMHVCVCEHVYT